MHALSCYFRIDIQIGTVMVLALVHVDREDSERQHDAAKQGHVDEKPSFSSYAGHRHLVEVPEPNSLACTSSGSAAQP